MSVLFCKQKTAYEMRISDWSSDVCSSDLLRAAHEQSVRDLNFKLESQKGRTSALDRKIDQLTKQLNAGQGGGGREEPAGGARGAEPEHSGKTTDATLAPISKDYPEIAEPVPGILETKVKRVVGKTCVSPVNSRWE